MTENFAKLMILCLLLKNIMLILLVISFSLVHFSTAVVNENDVTFRLFTRSNPQSYTLLTATNLKSISLNVALPFKFVVHGYLNNAGIDWAVEMKDSYLQNKECNVILVDWSPAAYQLYNLCAADTRDVGKYLGNFIIALNKELGNPFTNVHLIGHSLGAHISGFAGKTVSNTAGSQISRISGMDPAGPLFNGSPADQRLSVGDASFVDVIHTDSKKAGYSTSIGDIDFYPNGGACPQPGCLLTRKKRDLMDTISPSCCHDMSHIFTNEAINSNRFVSTKCDSYDNYKLGTCKNNPTTSMGESVDINARGDYYLKTNAQSPYAMGEV